MKAEYVSCTTNSLIFSYLKLKANGKEGGGGIAILANPLEKNKKIERGREICWIVVYGNWHTNTFGTRADLGLRFMFGSSLASGYISVGTSICYFRRAQVKSPQSHFCQLPGIHVYIIHAALFRTSWFSEPSFTCFLITKHFYMFMVHITFM